jgi:type II secretory pathway pseudopilin PulG
LKRVLAVLVIVTISGLVLVKGYRFAKSQIERSAKIRSAEKAYQSCNSRYKNYRSRDQYYAALRIPYVSPLSQREWSTRVRGLHVGISEPEVEKIIGLPDYAQCWINKERTREFSVWVYAVRMIDENLSYNKNTWVEIIFGPDGHAMQLHFQGIADEAASR